jgi:carbon storage regulator
MPPIQKSRLLESTVNGGQNMLVLSRKPGEAIVIGDGIEVVVLDANGGRVKLGVVAPAEVPVHREEIHRRVVRGQWPLSSPVHLPPIAGRSLATAGCH